MLKYPESCAYWFTTSLSALALARVAICALTFPCTYSLQISFSMPGTFRDPSYAAPWNNIDNAEVNRSNSVLTSQMDSESFMAPWRID
jgi:hypothetical protein